MLIEAHYFPCIWYWAEAIQSGHIEIEAHENYQKKSYRNKCKILSVNKPLLLSIPLVKGKHSKTKIQDVAIVDDHSWKSQHLQSIRSAYGNAPYFEFYWEDIEQLLESSGNSLYELNVSIIHFFAKMYRIPVRFSEQYEKQTTKYDLRHTIKPNASLNIFPAYDQVFSDKHAFEANLSILDLLFCLGPESIIYLKQLPISRNTNT